MKTTSQQTNFPDLRTQYRGLREIGNEIGGFFGNRQRKCLTKLALPNYIRQGENRKGTMVVSAGQNDNLSASLEDYLEAIFNLARESNIARSKDIAKLLGVSRASVTGALQVLRKKGLANYKPYDYVTLTETGRIAAAEIARKHKILKSFFIKVLGVEPDVAQQAACRTEHALGPGIIGRLMCFIEFVTHSSQNGCDLVDQFQQFCESRNQATKDTDT